MPMRRYEIRNEYSLGDGELYKAADKDDPEALLEGVAMSGLVGVLRQLGDLAEFAAEIFHDLHEEVMATAARGHGLMARVQQLEAEVPSIEKAFLSQTDHSLFFSNSGVDWRANLRMEQNLITRGDLPRFVMDSYEECRGPPRLFLLDKFDVAGAGACLKRYTDPSIFKVEAASSDISTIEIQREKKVRKVKKKASRWRNAETPDVAPASHPKLHQLFLEERVENGHSDPARVVKLRRRHLNGSLFDTKSGKSYMQKFVETPSPENKMVCVDSVSSPLRLTLDSSTDSGLDIHEISMVSPLKASPREKVTMFSPVIEEQDISEACANEMNEENFDRAIMKVPDQISEADTEESSSTIAVNADDKTEGSLDGVHSDDMNSETENYMDALTTMESEMETDNEYRLKKRGALMLVEKHGIDYDANEEHMDIQGNFSDSQSIGNSSLSYDGNSSVGKARHSFSCSDSPSQLNENTASDVEGPANTLTFTESHASEIVDFPPDSSYRLLENEATESHGHVESADACFKVDKIPDPGEKSCSSRPSDSKTAHPDSDLATTNRSSTEFANSNLGNSNSQDFLVVVSSDIHAMPELDQEDPNVLLDSLKHTSSSEEMGINNTVDNYVRDNDIVQEKDLIEGKIETLQPIRTSSNEQLPFTTSVDAETDSCNTFSPGHLDVVRPDDLDFVANAPISLTDVDTRNSEPVVDTAKPDEPEELDCLSATIDISQSELKSKGEVPVPYSEEIMNLPQTSGIIDDKEMVGFTDEVVTDVASFEEAGVSTVALDTKDEEETDRFPNKVDEVVGNAAISKRVYSSELEVAKVLKVEDVAPCAASGTDDTDVGSNNLASSTTDISPASNDLLDVQHSLSGSKVPQEEECSPETVSPECLVQVQALKEEKLDTTLAITEPSSYKSHSADDHPMLNGNLFASELPLSEADQDSVFDEGALSAGQGNWDVVLQTVPEIKSDENDHHVIGSSTLSLLQAESATELLVQRQNEQITASNLHTPVEQANFQSSSIPESIPSSEESAGLHSHQLRVQSLEENQLQSSSESLNIAGPISSTEQSSDFQPKQIKFLGGSDEASGFDVLVRSSDSISEDLPRQDLLPQPRDDQLMSSPLSFSFPNAGMQYKETDVKLEDMPPLPPLPPMQWRMGKVQPASVSSEKESVNQNSDTFPLTQLCPLPLGLAPSETIESSVSSLHCPDNDSINQQQMSALPCAEVQQTMDDAVDSKQAGFHLVESQLSNPFLTSSEVLYEKPDQSLLEYELEEKQSTSNSSSLEPSVLAEPTSSVSDPATSNDLQPFPTCASEMPEAQSENLVEEERIVPHTSVEKPTQIEHQGPDDPITSAGWSPSTLALPPAYGVGKLNGNKLPLPRNPLIDAVAAHDKSKLRKVAERVRPQLGPKLEERDSLLEQIRTKSFNLKPASVTRPGIQSMPGPKTNLKVAAILEKANAIRQALAGSDEDEDSDSWSDS